MRNCLVALCLTLLTTSAAFAAGPPPRPSPSWKLAFVRNGNIWIAHGDGSGQRLLIKTATAPAWSPDRKWIAFPRGGNVWVAKADGTGERQVSFLGKVEVGKPEQPAPEREIDISWDTGREMVTFSRQETYWVERGRKRVALWGATIYQSPLHPKPQHMVPQTLWDFTDEGADFNFTYHGIRPGRGTDGTWPLHGTATSGWASGSPRRRRSRSGRGYGGGT